MNVSLTSPSLGIAGAERLCSLQFSNVVTIVQPCGQGGTKKFGELGMFDFKFKEEVLDGEHYCKSYNSKSLISSYAADVGSKSLNSSS